jgi:hypothetical protein
MINFISANALTLDELKAPNVFKTKSQFTFKEMIISFFSNKEVSYLVFDLVLERDATVPSEPQEEDVPLVIDALISDLFPTLNLFNPEKSTTLQQSLQQRIDRILRIKFKWITGVKVLNMRIQVSGNE